MPFSFLFSLKYLACNISTSCWWKGISFVILYKDTAVLSIFFNDKSLLQLPNTLQLAITPLNWYVSQTPAELSKLSQSLIFRNALGVAIAVVRV